MNMTNKNKQTDNKAYNQRLYSHQHTQDTWPDINHNVSL